MSPEQFFDTPSEIVIPQHVEPIQAQIIEQPIEVTYPKAENFLQVDMTFFMGVALIVGVCFLGAGLLWWIAKS